MDRRDLDSARGIAGLRFPRPMPLVATDLRLTTWDLDSRRAWARLALSLASEPP